MAPAHRPSVWTANVPWSVTRMLYRQTGHSARGASRSSSIVTRSGSASLVTAPTDDAACPLRRSAWIVPQRGARGYGLAAAEPGHASTTSVTSWLPDLSTQKRTTWKAGSSPGGASPAGSRTRRPGSGGSWSAMNRQCTDGGLASREAPNLTRTPMASDEPEFLTSRWTRLSAVGALTCVVRSAAAFTAREPEWRPRSRSQSWARPPAMTGCPATSHCGEPPRDQAKQRAAEEHKLDGTHPPTLTRPARVQDLFRTFPCEGGTHRRPSSTVTVSG